jgi:hypothetical protein
MTSELMDALEVPILVVCPDEWKIRAANRCAGMWLGSVEGKLLTDLMPSAIFYGAVFLPISFWWRASG